MKTATKTDALQHLSAITGTLEKRRGPEVEEAGRPGDGLPVLHDTGGGVNLTVLVGGFRGRDGA